MSSLCQPILTFVFALLFAGSTASASTFVGNGGNVGDIELKIALNQIRDVFREVLKAGPKEKLELCTCYDDYKTHASCSTLESLTPEQVGYCENFMKERAAQMERLVSEDDAVLFKWTAENIRVKEKTGLRQADAVADPAERRITLHQRRFVELANHERVFLLTHELLHLTKVDGEYPDDDVPMGPFNTSEGGRRLLNAVAASTVQEVYGQDLVKKYLPTLQRSQGSKNNWLTAQWQSSNRGDEDSFGVTRTSGSQFSFRHQWGAIGVLAELRSGRGQGSVRETIKFEEAYNALALGVAYRLFPSDNPMTFWGQSHFVFAGKLEQMNLDYHLREEGFIDESDTAVSTTLTAEATYFMPLRNDFWVSVSFGYLPHKYSYRKVFSDPIHVQSSQSSFGLGVAYAF